MTEGLVVELRAARIPFIGVLAHHHWFVVRAADRPPDRWEVWQRRDVGGDSWGHLHRNLNPADAGVGNGPSWVVGSWQGGGAARLVRRLAMATERYPWRHRYFPWPGPNSNTFASWILEDAEVLGWRALGRHYRGWWRG